MFNYVLSLTLVLSEKEKKWSKNPTFPELESFIWGQSLWEGLHLEDRI